MRCTVKVSGWWWAGSRGGGGGRASEGRGGHVAWSSDCRQLKPLRSAHLYLQAWPPGGEIRQQRRFSDLPRRFFPRGFFDLTSNIEMNLRVVISGFKFSLIEFEMEWGEGEEEEEEEEATPRVLSSDL